MPTTKDTGDPTKLKIHIILKITSDLVDRRRKTVTVSPDETGQRIYYFTKKKTENKSTLTVSLHCTHAISIIIIINHHPFRLFIH